MPQRADLHSAPRATVVAQVSTGCGHLVQTKLQWDKDDIAYSLHARPSTFSTAGVQQTDLLSYLGFRRTQCHYQHGDGYCRWVGEVFDAQAFAVAFDASYGSLQQAERSLERCGFQLPQPEGFGYFFGKPSRGSATRPFAGPGDGHTSSSSQRMKEAEDDTFRFIFTCIEGSQAKGWTVHYRPKHPPLSPELHAALSFLGVKLFGSCPEFDFADCYWRFIQFESDGSAFHSNAHFAHGCFDAHSGAFSDGLMHLLAANAAVEPFGLGFLPTAETPAARRDAEIRSRTSRPSPPSKVSSTPDLFDVAISFAGTERPEAEALATKLKAAGLSVFYDDFYPEQLWGKDLVVFFDDIYRRRARYCVLFVSHEYVARPWTNHERRSAQARALTERGNEYILPIKVDDAELPGLQPTVGYLTLSDIGIDRIADLLMKKLAST
jgi:hypothetical protein